MIIRKVFLYVIASGLCISAEDDVRVYTTRAHAPQALSPAAIAHEKPSWKHGADHPGTGDLVVESGPLLAIFRSGAAGPEFYAQTTPGRFQVAATILPQWESNQSLTMAARSVRPSGKEQTAVEVTFAGGAGGEQQLGFNFKEAGTVAVVPSKRLRALAVAADCESLVLPNFYGDDAVFAAAEVAKERIYAPSDVVLHLIADGQAILMGNWEGWDTEVVAEVNRSGGTKRFTSTTIAAREGRAVFLSILASKNIWHRGDAAAFSTLEDKSLNWRVPFPAVWRLDLRRADAAGLGFIDSWWSAQRQDGKYNICVANPSIGIQNHETRNSWVSGRHDFLYPFFIEGDRAQLRLPVFSGQDKIRYSGPFVIYPLERIPATPKGPQTPYDILVRCFGPESPFVAGIKDMRGKTPGGMATCGGTEQIENIFSDNQEHAKQNEIANCIKSMDAFVRTSRVRIDEYRRWSEAITGLLQAGEKASASKVTVASYTAELAKIGDAYEAVKEKIKTPDEVAVMMKKYIELIDRKSENKDETCQLLGREIRTIGGAQDGLLAQFRTIVSDMMHTAQLQYSVEEDSAKRRCLLEVMVKTREVLATKYWTEGK